MILSTVAEEDSVWTVVVEFGSVVLSFTVKASDEVTSTPSCPRCQDFTDMSSKV